MPQLESLADEMEPKIKAIPGIVDFKGIEKGNPEMIIQVDPVQAGRLGMTVDQVTEQMQSGLERLSTTQFPQSDPTAPLRVRFPDSLRYHSSSVPPFSPVTSPH